MSEDLQREHVGIITPSISLSTPSSSTALNSVNTVSSMSYLTQAGRTRQSPLPLRSLSERDPDCHNLDDTTCCWT